MIAYQSWQVNADGNCSCKFLKPLDQGTCTRLFDGFRAEERSHAERRFEVAERNRHMDCGSAAFRISLMRQIVALSG